MKERPDIHHFSDHLKFLREMYDYLKENTKINARSFMRSAGFKSPSYFAMVVNGKRKLTNVSVRQFGKGLKLSSEETQILQALVNYNQARDFEERDVYYRELLRIKGQRFSKGSDFLHYEYFSKWYVAVLHVALATRFRERSLTRMAAALRISEVELKNALETLKELNLIEKTSRGWVAKPVLLETPRETESLLIRNYHRQMSERGLEALNREATHTRSAQALTLALSEEEFEDLKTKLTKFRENIARVHSESSKPRAVYQVNFQIFPILDLGE